MNYDSYKSSDSFRCYDYARLFSFGTVFFLWFKDFLVFVHDFWNQDYFGSNPPVNARKSLSRLIISTIKTLL